ncbi:abc transporter atp-binding protein [Lasius niger]|uniref:Abc transporter atp-binding protein n=1 Tax=Lasius niger TaxID=67767 RepID=A0A0J7K4W1_LASNI|nr:abc transporter atp-binding protein [Lasius niger]
MLQSTTSLSPSASIIASWTHENWNPVLGCEIASPGCSHCYAMEIAGRLLKKNVQKYKGLVDLSKRHPVWTGIMRPDFDRLKRPYAWKKSRLVFVNSMTDLFHDPVPDSYLLKIWEVMAKTPWHHYWLLTKRPERMRHFIEKIAKVTLPNLWLGASVEHAQTLSRIETLRKVPAAIRFVTFEPLIASVGTPDLRQIDLIYVGGESGDRARPMRTEWIEAIFKACRRDGAGFCFHQWGTYGEDGIKRNRKENGNLFKGKTWNEVPPSAYDSVIEASQKWEKTKEEKKLRASVQKLTPKAQENDLFDTISPLHDLKK